MKEIKGKFNTAKIFATTIEQSCEQQVLDLCNESWAKDCNIRIMPDCHSGKGCVIGTTMTIADKIVPNLVGVDIGCFTGDTKVKLTDNRDLSFLELIKEYNEGKENYCYSIDDNKNITISKIIKPRKITTTNKLIEITLDNNQKIQCTADHIFYKRDGNQVEAQFLKVDDSLMPCYIKLSEEVEIENKSFKDKRLKMAKYNMIYNPNTNLWDYIHRLSDKFNIDNNIYSIEKNNEIRHHKDFNKYNNNPNNIIRVGWKEHWKIHSDNIKLLNSLGKTGFGIARRNNPEFFSNMASKNLKKLHLNPEFCKRRNERASNQFKKYCKSDKFIEQSKKAGKRGAEYLRKFNEINNSKEYICDKCGRIVKGKGSFARHYKHCKNHKIISIRNIDVINCDVYCLTVEKYHNFALAAGVFVHNCGMLTIALGKIDLDLKVLDRAIKCNIPMGRSNRAQIKVDYTEELNNLRCKNIIDFQQVNKSIGSLGGGNHFIEMAIDSNDCIYLVIHTGSRNLGKRIADYYQNIAIANSKNVLVDQHKALIDQMKTTGQHQMIEKVLNELKSVSTDSLAYLEGVYYDDYLNDMAIAQKMASLNRKTIEDIICRCMHISPIDQFETIHNYIDISNKILRKGAISAQSGEKCLIPINMRDGSLICIGKGNPDFNYSAPHGAGRLMSRTEAKRTLSLNAFQDTMQGIYSSTINESTLDEAPMAYKPINEILENIKGTVDVIQHLKPIYNIKSEGE